MDDCGRMEGICVVRLHALHVGLCVVLLACVSL